MLETKKTSLLLLNILEKITSDSSLHSRFLNTLSYLEYIGNRKMLKSLPSSILNHFFLDHINEESRHSLILKRLAQKVAEKDMTFRSDEMIASERAYNYFQEVDHYSLKFNFKDPVLNYFYTSYAIEQRALLFYSLYNDTLKKKSFPFSLDVILNDEIKHLRLISEQIQKRDENWQNNLDEISQFEHKKYFSLLVDLEKSVFNIASPFPPYFSLKKNKRRFIDYQI
ncbi:MAG: hypothetical protein GDA46_03825 [Bdellovibrionales bacterium]|nr:hypothetical protein [Bdellovibrionales bacterium]